MWHLSGLGKCVTLFSWESRTILVFALTPSRLLTEHWFWGAVGSVGVHSREAVEGVVGLLCVMDEWAVLPTLGAGGSFCLVLRESLEALEFGLKEKAARRRLGRG